MSVETEKETKHKYPIPPFSYDDAVRKVRMAEDAWNTRDPDKARSLPNCFTLAFVYAFSSSAN